MQRIPPFPQGQSIPRPGSAGQTCGAADGGAAARRGAGHRAAALAGFVPGARHGVPAARRDARREANVRLAKPDATREEIETALRQAALADFVADLPDGLQTRVGERGVQLSGGQRQRIAIARAFLKDAPILVLDEATSHLDTISEQLVRSALDTLMVNRTTIVVAHRLSTIQAADIILVLNAGRVVEAGTHQQLLARRGVYAQLVEHQMAGVAERQAAD